VKAVRIVLPVAVKATMPAIATRDAISPYSMAVAPVSSLRKLENHNMATSSSIK